MKMRIDAYLFDIDGTISDNSNRIHLIDDGKNYNEYNEIAIYDKPIEHVVKIGKILNRDYPVLFITGREKKYAESTVAWIEAHFGKFKKDDNVCPLYMRPEGNEKTNSECKKEILLKRILPIYNILCAFDDNSLACDMYKTLGIPCLQIK